MRDECARILERSPGPRPAFTHARVGRGINKAVSHSRLVCVKSACEKSNRSKLSEIVRSKETGVRVRVRGCGGARDNGECNVRAHLVRTHERCRSRHVLYARGDTDCERHSERDV